MNGRTTKPSYKGPFGRRLLERGGLLIASVVTSNVGEKSYGENEYPGT